MYQRFMSIALVFALFVPLAAASALRVTWTYADLGAWLVDAALNVPDDWLVLGAMTSALWLAGGVVVVAGLSAARRGRGVEIAMDDTQPVRVGAGGRAREAATSPSEHFRTGGASRPGI